MILAGYASNAFFPEGARSEQAGVVPNPHSFTLHRTGGPDLKTGVNIIKVKVHVHLAAPRLGVLVSYNFRQAFQRSQTAKKWNKSLTVRDPFKLEVKILNAHIKKICMCTVMQLFY